jgi:hypothetical protein
MLTFILVDNDRDSHLRVDDDDRDCTRPIKSKANNKGSCLLSSAKVLRLGL